jgi:hypothetical protein
MRNTEDVTSSRGIEDANVVSMLRLCTVLQYGNSKYCTVQYCMYCTRAHAPGSLYPTQTWSTVFQYTVKLLYRVQKVTAITTSSNKFDPEECASVTASESALQPVSKSFGHVVRHCKTDRSHTTALKS